MSEPVSVFIVGAGVTVPDHLTLASLRALKLCNEIHTILAAELQALLPDVLQPKLRSLVPVYRPGRLRREAYSDEVRQVIDAALRTPPVAYLTLGNPILFDSVTQGIVDEAMTRNLSVKVMPAVSSIDTMLVDLLEDIAPGLQIYDATSVVIYNVCIRSDFPCLLLQPSVFGTGFVAIAHEPKAKALVPLRDHLLKFYPADHEIAFLTSAMMPSAEPSFTCLQVGELADEGRQRPVPGASIYVPRLRAPMPHQELLDNMTDAAAFRRSFRQRGTAKPSKRN